jgi:hypothetical protein
MRLAERSLAVLLSEEGRQLLQMTAVPLPETPDVGFYVEDSDDMGLWVRIQRGDGDHLVLVRWEYVLSLDIPAGQVRTVGLRE